MLARAGLGLGVMALVWSFLTQDNYSMPASTEIRRAQVGVVFTGDYARIDAGLDLLARGEIATLFISGANPNAGIWLPRFEQTFGRGLPDLHQIVACCVRFGELADTTWQNGRETRCWIRSQPVRISSILLITSLFHMARARAALAAALPRVEIIPYPVRQSPPADRLGQRLAEFAKRLLILGLSLLPANWVPASVSGPFARGCPDEAAWATRPAGAIVRMR